MATNKPFEFFIQWHLTEKVQSPVPALLPGRAQQRRAAAGGHTENRRRGSRADQRTGPRTYGLDFRPSMNLTGGEPFLRRDLFDIIEDVKAQGLRGPPAHERHAGGPRACGTACAALGVDGVQVSVDGPGGSARRHPRTGQLRGVGSGHRAARGLRPRRHA